MKKLVFVVFLILCLGFSSAHDVYYKEKFVETRYYDDDLRIVSRTTWTDYDDDERYSTWDYRHGYSYRATRDYFDRKVYSKMKEIERESDNYREDYYRYASRSERDGERGCYFYPPRDKLFYIKC